MQAHLIRNLEQLGLTSVEAKTYLALLQLGTGPLSAIATQAGLGPATTLTAMEGLINRGLAHSVEQSDAVLYAAEEPEQLGILVERHRRQVKEAEVILQETVPELATILTHQERPVVKYFIGAEGFFAMEQEGKRNLKKGAMTYSFTALDLLQQYQRDYFDRYAEERLVGRQPLRVIYTHKDGPQPFASDPKQLRETRFIPREKYPFECSIVIRPWWGLRIYSFSRQKGFIGISIASVSIARTLQSIFGLVWEQLPAEDQK